MGNSLGPTIPVSDSDGCPIRLTAEQSVALHGFLRAKNTLTWRDVATSTSPRITFMACVQAGVDVRRLHAMQPDIRMWAAHSRATLFDCQWMELWAPHPFQHFNCQIADLVMHRKHLPPAVLIKANITVTELWDRYGLNGELMAMLHYEPQHWLDMGLQTRHVEELTDEQFARIFAPLLRAELVKRLQPKERSSG